MMMATTATTIVKGLQFSDKPLLHTAPRHGLGIRGAGRGDAVGLSLGGAAITIEMSRLGTG